MKRCISAVTHYLLALRCFPPISLMIGLQRMTGMGSSNAKRPNANSGVDTAAELRQVLTYIHSLLKDFDGEKECVCFLFLVVVCRGVSVPLYLCVSRHRSPNIMSSHPRHDDI